MAFNPDEYLKGEAPSAASNAFDPDAYLKSSGTPEEEPGALGSFGREAVRSVVPGITATAIAPVAAKVATALTPAALRPVAAIVGGLGGAMATGMGVRKLQDVAADEVAPESIMGTKSAQADYEANPIASFGGSLIGMGRPSLSQPIGVARAIGTSEGRAGVAQVAKSLANKDARTALTQAVEAGEPGARRAMEDFGNLLGGAAGLGAQTGMELAQGRDLPTAAAMGVAGLAVKPWVGPGGVFLNGQKPKAPSVLDTVPEAAPVEDGAPLETPVTPEEQQLVDDAIAGKSRAVEATESAAEVAEATGILPQTAAALRQQAKQIAEKPIVPPVAETTGITEAAAKPAGPKITSAAQAYAEKLGVDIAQVPANERGSVTKKSIDQWRKANPALREGEAPSSVENKSIPGWKSIDVKDLTDEEFLAKIKGAYGVGSPVTESSSTAPKPAPKAGASRPDPTRVPDETLLAGVAQSKTKKEFVDWAKTNGYGGTLRPVSGGQIAAEIYWDLNRPPVAPEAPAPAPEPPPVVPEAPAPAPEPPPVAPETVAPAVPPKVTKEAQTLADKLGIDVSLVRPNKQGNISRRDVEKWVNENQPKSEDVVLEEEPSVAAPEELVNTDLEIFPQGGNQRFSNVVVDRVSPSRSQIGLALSPFRQKRFGTIEEAEYAAGDLDRVQVRDFFDRVDRELGPGVKEDPRAEARISRSDAFVNLPDGYAASSLSRYSGATGWNWMRTLETLKAVKSGEAVDLFRQRNGGEASLYEVTTDTGLFNDVNQRLREAGIKGATLTKNPETNFVQVHLLVKNSSQSPLALKALKKFVGENNYGKIKVYKGDAESIGADVESATARLRDALGQYTSGGSRDQSGGADRNFVASKLGELAREAGIDLGPIPEYTAPRLDSRGRPLKDKATSVFGYERDVDQLKAAIDKIPADKRARFTDLYVRAYDRIVRELGMSRLSTDEVRNLAESSKGDAVKELYVERLQKLYQGESRANPAGPEVGSETSLVPTLKQRTNNRDKLTDYGTAYLPPESMSSKFNFVGRKDSLVTIALGDIIDDLAKQVDGKPTPARKTKANLARIASIEKQIAALQEKSSRAEKTPLAEKKKLAELTEKLEAAENQVNPWDRSPEDFKNYVVSKLRKAVDKQARVTAKADEAGLKEIEDTVVTEGENGKEEKSITGKAPAPEENLNAGLDAGVKKAAYDALRNRDLRSEDRYAIGKLLLQSGALNLSEIKALTPEVNRLVKRLDALDQKIRDKNEALTRWRREGWSAAEIRTLESQTPRETGELLSRNYTLEELVAQKHRRKDGRLRAARLLSPMEEAAVPVDRDAPPQVLRETNAREFLAELLDSKTISSEDSALVRRLLNEANLDNIPLRFYDYLDGAYGAYDRRTGEVAINFETSSSDRNVETSLHEIGHALLGYFLNPRNASSLNVRQKKLVGDINNFFKQTTEAAIRDGKFTREQLNSVRSMADRGDIRFSSPSDRTAYRYSSVDEWTSAMMSNPEFRDYMKTLRMRNTVTGKMRQAWETFKDLVARLFGVDRSVYRKSFDKIMELTVDPEAGRLPGTRGEQLSPNRSASPIDENSFRRLPFSPDNFAKLWRLVKNMSVYAGRDFGKEPNSWKYAEQFRAQTSEFWERPEDYPGLPNEAEARYSIPIPEATVENYARLYKFVNDVSSAPIDFKQVRKPGAYNTPGDPGSGAYRWANMFVNDAKKLVDDIEAGRPYDWRRFDYSPTGDGSRRSTRKVSEVQVNERLADKDKVMLDSQRVPAALQAAMIWKSNGGRLQDLPNSNLSNPEVLQAAELFYEDAMAVKGSVDRMKNPSAKDLAARRAAEDDILEATQLVGRMSSDAGQTLGHSQYLGSRRTINIQDVYKTLLGQTPEEMASGKIDLSRMMEGIREIKAKAADTTLLVMGDELKSAGIIDEANLGMVRDTLAHTSSSYRDLLITLADMMPSNNEAQTRALAEKIYRFYTISANSISKARLPQIVTETYNGESTVPAGDKFLKKLSEFVKLGKYSEDEINATVLESLGPSGYDKEFIAGIRKDLFKIAAMPEGQMRDAASVEVNQKVKTKLYNNVLKFDPNTPQGHKHIMDMLTSAWQAGVLSGPPTSLVNLLGSATSTTIESFMEGLGYALKTGDVRYLGDVYSGFLSALLGNKATGRASSALAEGKSALSGQGTKYRNESIGDTPILENIDTTGTSAPVKLLGGYAQKLRYVGRVMSALDAVNMSMADEAKQRMVARFFLTESKGHRASEVADMMHKLFDPDEVVMTNARKQAEEDVKTYLSDKSAKEQERWVTRRTLEILTQQREELVPNIAEAGKGAAERFTYNETARGFIGKTMVNLSAQINETLPAGRFVLSFMNTLANIMNQTLDYTPYGYLRAKNKWRVGTVDPNTKYARRVYKEGSPEQMAQIARASVGTSIMMAVAYMAYKGYEDEQNGETPYFTVTGAGPKNSFDKQQLVDTGAWRPNSVKIGNTWFRYMDFPIIGAALGFMGTMLDAARYKKDDQTSAEVVWDAALAGATTVFDKQLFQGANNFFEMLRGGQPGQQVFAMKRLVGGTIGGFTNPGMARWLRNTLDVDSQGMVDRLEQKTTAGWVASMVPFSIGYNTAALNTLGEPIQQPWYSATTWRFADLDKSKPHPIITPLIQAGLMLPNPSPSTQFRILNSSEGTIVKTRLGKYPEVMRRFVELRGQSLKQILTPEYIANLQQAAAQNQDAAQDYLDSKIGGAARDLAIRQIEQEIIDGKLKL